MKAWDPANRPKPTTSNPRPQPKPPPEVKTEAAFELPKELPDYWYQTPGNLWWMRNEDGVYTPYPTNHVRDILLNSGVRGSITPGERLAPVSRILLALRQQHSIAWAGQLAGFGHGATEICGNRVLITKSPTRIKAKKGDWNTLKKFLQELFKEDVAWFHGWMKSALRAMYGGAPFRAGQCLAFAGKTGCGKSLLQGIITELLGGRAAKPFDWLMGETSFNKDIFGSEHLMLEDEASSIDIRKRSYFGQKLKNLVANDLKRCHPKGADGLYLQAFWRVTMSLNDEPESLLVLPPITEDIKDKILLLHAHPATFPYGDDDINARKQYRERLSSELPAFIDFLYGWKIPRAMVDQRYGIRGYQCKTLIEQLHSLQPEFRLLDLIDHLHPWDVDNNVWEGTSSQLQDCLEEKDTRGRVAKLLAWHSACGQFLAKLAKHCPDRIELKERLHNQAIWRIKPR